MREGRDAFSETERALTVDLSPRSSLVALVVLGALVALAVVVELPTFERSATAKIEGRAPTHEVRVERASLVGRVHVSFDDRVQKGAPLFDLDTREAELLRHEAAARLTLLEREREGLLATLAASTQAAAKDREVLQARKQEALAHASSVEAVLAQASRDHERLSVGALDGLVTTQDRERAKTLLSTRRAEVQAARAVVERLAAEEARPVIAVARADTIVGLEQALARLDGDLAGARVGLAEAEILARRHRLLSPISGRVSHLVLARPGDLVSEGDLLATIVPESALRVVAEFPATRALGWLREGHRARLRLEPFPWLYHGEIPLRVRLVERAPRHGMVRVELDIEATTRIPIRHGLTGTVEVEVDRTSPIGLLLRAAGRRS